MEQKRDLVFRRKISHKLTWALSLILLLILTVGAVSLYLAYSISRMAQEITAESDAIYLLDRVHSSFHHLIEGLQEAVLEVNSLTETQRLDRIDRIREQLRQYYAMDHTNIESRKGLWQLLRDLDMTSADILQQTLQSPAEPPRQASLRALADIGARIPSLIHLPAAQHRVHVGASIGEASWRMQIITGLYGAFVIVAFFLISGAGFFFSRTIAQPLRAFAQSALKIAEGQPPTQSVAVKSKDEIGQLSHAFNIMVERLRDRDERLQSLAMLEERERIAQDIHDTLAQDLLLLQMKLTELEMQLPQDRPKALMETLGDMRTVADSAYEDVRQAVFGLNTMVSKGLGLVPTLTEYLHEFSAMRKISVELKILTPKPIQLSALAEIQVIQIIHEALSNAFKHSEAKTSVVTFDRDGPYVRVSIEDDGKGFNPQQITNGYHFGIQSMRKRAQRVNGQVNIESAPGKGTRVIAFIPSKEDLNESDTNPAR